jgi:hypothetical protein
MSNAIAPAIEKDDHPRKAKTGLPLVSRLRRTAAPLSSRRPRTSDELAQAAGSRAFAIRRGELNDSGDAGRGEWIGMTFSDQICFAYLGHDAPWRGWFVRERAFSRRLACSQAGLVR